MSYKKGLPGESAPKRRVRIRFPSIISQAARTMIELVGRKETASIMSISLSTLYRWCPIAPSEELLNKAKSPSHSQLIPYIKRLGENCSAYGFPFNEKEVVRVLSDRAKTSRKRKKHPREFFEPSADGLRKREPILCGEGHQPFGKVIQSAKEELINKRAFSDAHPRMQLAKRLIESDFKIGRSTLHVAEVLGVTGFHLIRAFFQAFGVTPHKYQVACRVDCASQMFLESNQTMEVISRAAGFGSVSAMHRAFKKVLGASPSTLFPSLAGTNSSTQWNRCVE